MLLYITFFCGILYTASAQDNRFLVSISPPQVLELRKHAGPCGKQYGVDPSDLHKVLHWPLPNDKPHKQFYLCAFKAAGYHDEVGHFVIDKMLTLKPHNGTLEDMRHAFEDCNKITLETNYDTVYEMGECFFKHLMLKVETASV